MRVLVTGGTGFIGSHIARRMVADGHEVIITGNQAENEVPGAKLLECHFNGINYWNGLERRFDLVFHQAANNNTMETDDKEMYMANVEGPLDSILLDAAKKGCKQFVFASSTAVYGNGPTPYKETQLLGPLNAYARSKVEFEKEFMLDMSKEYPDANIVGLRYCNVYGPGEDHKGKRSSMIRRIIMSILEGKRPRLFFDGEQKRDLIYIDDVVEANLLAAKYKGRTVFNCGFGTARSFNDIVRTVQKNIGPTERIMSSQPEYFDNPNPEAYQEFTECSMKKAKDELGFVPRFDLEAGIRAYLPYLREKYFSLHSA